jgi:hypothetical protein
VTVRDWSFKDCQDYLVELEMATRGALISLKLAHNDFNSHQVDHQITCLSARAREARTLALRLRQEHLNLVMGNTNLPTQNRENPTLGTGAARSPGTSNAQSTRDSGGMQSRRQGCPRFSGRLEDLGRFKVAWEDYVREHYMRTREDPGATHA